MRVQWTQEQHHRSRRMQHRWLEVREVVLRGRRRPVLGSQPKFQRRNLQMDLWGLPKQLYSDPKRQKQLCNDPKRHRASSHRPFRFPKFKIMYRITHHQHNNSLPICTLIHISSLSDPQRFSRSWLFCNYYILIVVSVDLLWLTAPPPSHSWRHAIETETDWQRMCEKINVKNKIQLKTTN